MPIEKLEQLLGEVQTSADPNLRATVQEIVQLVIDLHREGLERTLELIHDEKVIHRLGRDELVSSLLILHGLHPLTLEQRVNQAVEKLRGVELLSMNDGAVRLQVNSKGCGVKDQVEQTIYQYAPDLISLTIEGPEEKQSFVPLEALQGVTP